MTEDGHPGTMDRSSEPPQPAESVEAYETETGTVLYDAGNPLAWIESSVTISIGEAT